MPGPVVSRGAGVSIQLHPPIEFILRQTGRFRAHLLNLLPLWDRFEGVLAEIETRRFAEEGPGWEPLAEATLRDKARHGYPADILVRTGDLRSSLTDPGRASNKSPRQMEYGSDVEYAVYHQTGTDKMPQRQVIADPFPAEDRRRLEHEMVSWINHVAGETFGVI